MKYKLQITPTSTFGERLPEELRLVVRRALLDAQGSQEVRQAMTKQLKALCNIVPSASCELTAIMYYEANGAPPMATEAGLGPGETHRGALVKQITSMKSRPR